MWSGWRANWGEFQRRAEGGDEEMKGLVEEVKERGLLDGTNGVKTQQQKLEEFFGGGGMLLESVFMRMVSWL